MKELTAGEILGRKLAFSPFIPHGQGLKENVKRTYSQQNKEVKKNTQKDYIERLATDAEEAAARQDMVTLYHIAKSLSGWLKMQKLQSRNRIGELTSCTEEELTCLKEHFERVLNRDDPSVEAEISPVDKILDIYTGKPTLEVVTKSINTPQKWKSTRMWHAEMLKAEKRTGDGETRRARRDAKSRGSGNTKSTDKYPAEHLGTEAAQTQWQIGLIAKLPKKGDLTDTNNYIGESCYCPSQARSSVESSWTLSYGVSRQGLGEEDRVQTISLHWGRLWNRVTDGTPQYMVEGPKFDGVVISTGKFIWP